MKNIFTTATPWSVATFSRASTAYAPDGSVAAVNQARYGAGRDGRAIMVEQATSNLLANPLMATTTSWGASYGGTLIIQGSSPSGSFPPGATACLKGTAAAGQSFCYIYQGQINLSLNTAHTLSAWVYVPSSVPAGLAAIQIWYYNAEWVALSGGNLVITERNVWVKKTLSFTSHATYAGHIFGVGLAGAGVAGLSTYACMAQVESKAYATSFAVGARSGEFLSVPTSGRLTPSTGTVETWVYFDTKHLASYNQWLWVSTTTPYSPYNNTIGIKITGTIEVWCYDAAALWQGLYVTKSLTVGWHHIALTWDATELALHIDGAKKGNRLSPSLPTALGSSIYIGSYASSMQGDFLFSGVRLSSTARTTAEIAAAYTSAPLLLDSASTALFAVPDITGEALLMQPADTVTFNAPPLRGDGETPQIFQPTGRDSGGNLYAYLKANFFRQVRKLTFARLTDDILSALRTFDSSVAHGAKIPFAWYDHTGALHTARLTSAISSQQIGHNQHKTEMSLEEDANLPIPAVANWDTAKNSKTGAAPVWILRLTINGVNYYLSGYAFTIAATSIVTTPGWPANVSVTTLPWIGAWGRITTQISGDLNEYSVSDFDCDILVDPAASPNIATLCKSYPVEQSPAELYLWFHGLNPATDPPRLMMRGYVDEVSRLTSKQASIVIKDESARLAAYIGAKIDLTTYPDADPDDVGKVIPIVFGTVSKAPSRCVVSGFVTTITANINADATSITVTAADQISTNTSWLIDNEEVRVTGKSGNTLTVTRGYNSTTAVGHNKAAAFREKMTAALVYLLADHPVTSIGTVYARVNGLDIDVSSACAKYTGNTGSQHTTYPNKAVVTIPDTIAFAKAVLMAPVDGISLTGGTHTHTGIFSGADGDPDLPRRATQVVNGTPVSLYLNETLPTTGAGSRTKTTWTVNANLTGDRKAIGLGNSTGVQVWVYTSDTWPDGAFAWTGSFTDSKKDYDRIYVGVETISSGRYYTMVVEWLNVTRNVEYTGESSSSTVSKDGTVVLSGNSVADTIIGGTLMADIVSPTTTPLACAQFLLNLTPLSAYTIQQVGTFPSFYKFNGVIDRYETALYWLSYLAFQARAWFRIDAGVARLIFRPDPGTLTIAKTIAACKVSSDHTPTVSQSKVDYAKVINKLNLLCDRDWTVDRGDKAYKQVYKASRQSSIDIHGTKENPDLFRFDFITDIYMAGVVGSFYLDTYGARRWQSDFESFLDNCELSFSQGIQMTFAGGAQAEITGMEFAPGSTGEIDAIKIIGEGTI